MEERVLLGCGSRLCQRLYPHSGRSSSVSFAHVEPFPCGPAVESKIQVKKKLIAGILLPTNFPALVPVI